MSTSQKPVASDNLIDVVHTSLDGAAIFSLPSIQSYIVELKQLISTPNEVYEELYRPTFYNFMALCQNMPEDMQNPVPYSLLTRRLEFAIATLKLRRGCMLPLYSCSEMVAEQEPLWTYALFTASLLVNIYHIQFDRSVEIHKKIKNKEPGIWHLVLGGFEPRIYYKITTQAPCLLLDKQPLQKN